MLAEKGTSPIRPANTFDCSARSRYVGYEKQNASSPSDDVRPCFGPGERRSTSSPGLATGSVRMSTRSTSAKMAALAPMPRASVATATAENVGFLVKLLRA
jgi:hypothetical protein